MIFGLFNTLSLARKLKIFARSPLRLHTASMKIVLMNTLFDFHSLTLLVSFVEDVAKVVIDKVFFMGILAV